jgi:hypothetical protein
MTNPKEEEEEEKVKVKEKVKEEEQVHSARPKLDLNGFPIY